jgi:hypothetical protein
MTTENDGGAAAETGLSQDALDILAASGLNADGSPVTTEETPAGNTDKGKASADPAAEKTEQEKEAAEKAAAEAAKAARPKKSYQERIDEMTRARREAERERDALRQEVEELRAASGDGEIDNEIIEQLVERRLQERTARAKAEEAATTFESRMAAAAEKHEDFFEKVHEGANAGEWSCTPEMLAAIQESEQAGEISYHLATNPDESRRIAALSVPSQIREIGKLEAKLEAAAKADANPNPTPAANAVAKPQGKTVTSAPPPPPQARGAGGQFKVAPDTDDFAAFDTQYQIKP